jgi:tRNA G18 (ribose-2'-O)-methylase SpoU
MTIQIMKKKKEISVLLHNIRSVHNVGSIFRTCDALGVSAIYISGYTPRPLDRFGRARSDVAKVALGAEKNVRWEQIKNPRKFLDELKEKGTKIIALEQAENSVDYKKVKISGDNIFIVGNEVTGIPKNILSLADIVAEIPMAGKKESLNVSVAFGVAMFRIFNK